MRLIRSLMDEFKSKIASLDPDLKERGEAFYVQSESCMYIRGESITNLVKFMALMLHEAVHAYLPANVPHSSSVAEALTVMVLAKSLKLNADRPAFKLIADQLTKDLLEKMEKK